MLCFQAPLANIFLLTLFRSKIIQLIDFPASLPHALEWDLELGAHTNIVHFHFNCSSPPITSMTCNKYVRWNANMQPYRHNIPFLCPTCASVWPWTVTAKDATCWNIQSLNPNCGLNWGDPRTKTLRPHMLSLWGGRGVVTQCYWGQRPKESSNGEPLGAGWHTIYTKVHEGCTRLSVGLCTVHDIIVELGTRLYDIKGGSVHSTMHRSRLL